MTRLRSMWRRLRALDPLVTDVALAAVLTVPIAAIALALSLGLIHAKNADQGIVGPILAISSLVALRRRQPLLACVVQLAIVAATAPIWPSLAETFPAALALLLVTYSSGAHSRARLWSLAVVAVGSTGLLVATIHDGTGYSFLLLPLAWLIGNSIRAERQNHALVAERARRLEQEQAVALRVAASEERARIARELHDVIAHTVSVMVVQAEAAQRILQRQPAEAAEAVRSVSDSGREALAEMRKLLGLLGDGGVEPLTPQPGLTDLPALIARVRAAGLPVEMVVEGQRRPLPPGIELTAYRVVQEGLTNALKHSGRAPTRVIVRYADTDVGIEVVDDGRPGLSAAAPGAGRGLLGMRERVALYGGELEASRQGGGFGVRVRLPLGAPAQV
ncbi:MAG: histidine kinase [Candidatus Dormibacteraeota bacterium]|nr:histidine kinase [Candidatus Dormibacteraeota bacterium]